MSLYSDPVAYARKTRIPIRLSRIWCAYQISLEEEIKKARKCPKCGEETLALEGGCYEEGTRDYVYCENDRIPCVDEDDGETYFTECDYTANPEKEHEPLSAWYDFDVILAFSCERSGSIREFEGLQEWLKFVRHEVEKVSLLGEKGEGQSSK